MSSVSQFPKCVVLHVNGPATEAVCLCIRVAMRTKNCFNYAVFVDSPGTATVSGDELLKAFDQERQTFIMDYDDPRLAFAGKVTAKVLSTAELRSALDAFNMFRGEISYPNGYESRLIGALRRGQNPDAYEVEVQIIP